MIAGPVVNRVLVADDDPDIRDILSFNLEAEGFTVVTAVDGDEAWALARQALPRLIILDVMMPGRDGFEVLANLRSDPSTSDIPVLLLTARATHDDVWGGWQSGADFYLTKPFDIDQLLACVNHLLAPPSEAEADEISELIEQ